jgi:hypothetical protein
MLIKRDHGNKKKSLYTFFELFQRSKITLNIYIYMSSIKNIYNDLYKVDVGQGKVSFSVLLPLLKEPCSSLACI